MINCRNDFYPANIILQKSAEVSNVYPYRLCTNPYPCPTYPFCTLRPSVLLSRLPLYLYYEIIMPILRVLIIDDEPIIRKDMEVLLKKH